MPQTPPDPALEALRSPLEQMLRDQFADHVGQSKSQHLLDIQRNHLYWKGEHYVAPKLEGGRVRLTNGSVQSNTGSADPQEVQDYVLNYIYGEGLKLIGILGRIPNTTAIADSEDGAAVSRAKRADEIIRGLWPHLKLETAHFDVLFGHWINGTMFAYTPFVVNPQEYGYTEVPRYELQPQVVSPAHYLCWRCGTPSPEELIAQSGGLCPTCASQGTRTPLAAEDYYPAREEMVETEVQPPNRFPNGSVELHLYSALEVTTPYNVKKFEHAPWLMLEMDVDKSILMSTHPELIDRFSEFMAGASDAPGSTQRQQAQNSRATAHSYRSYTQAAWKAREWTYTRVWVTPQMYYAAVEPLGPDKMAAEVENLKQLYPSGMKITYVNGKLLKIEDEKLTDVWTACKPTVGETLYPQPLCAPYIQMNNLINDTTCIAVQTAQKGMSLNFYDPEVINTKLFRRNRAAVADYIPAIAGASGRLRDAVFQTTAVQLDPSVMTVATIARQAGQEITGITPPLTGLDSREKTLGESEMNRNQALLPHNTQWAYIREFWSEVVTKCIVQLARFTTGRLNFRTHTALPVSVINIADIDELLSGGWHVECDQSIPLTWGQRRAQVFQLLERGPEVIRLFGLDRPKNLKTLYEIIGNEDFEVPGMAEEEKVMADIRDLLAGQPIPGPNGEFLPSIPPDEFEMDHMQWVQIAKQWFIDDAGRTASKENKAGYANVLARAKAELNIVNMLIAQQRAQQPQQANGGGPDSGAPAPNDLSTPPPPGTPALEPAQPEEMAAVGLEGV